MNMGVERTGAQPRNENEWTGAAESAVQPIRSFQYDPVDEEEARRRGRGSRLLAGLLVLLGIAWIAAGAYAVYRFWPGENLLGWVSWVATLCMPLVLLGLLWLIFGRVTRREATRFAEAVAAMRRESQALESVLSILGGQIQEHRVVLSEEATRLMALGDEASDRLGRVTHFIAREAAELDRKAQALDSAAESARVDIGVLLADLPRAEEQARAVADAMKAAGLIAHEHAGALEGQLSALIARGREADDAAGGAAQRLSAQITRIDSSTAAATERMDQASAQMNAAVDGAMARVSDSIEQARTGFETQGQAMLAMVEQGRAAFEQAGAQATGRLAERLDMLSGKMETLAAQLAAQDEASQSQVASLSRRLAEVDEQFAQFGVAGETRNARLVESVGSLRTLLQQFQTEVDEGGTASNALVTRTHEVAQALTVATSDLRRLASAALGEIESQARRTGEAVGEMVPSIEAVQAAAALAAESMSESEASLARQHETLESQLAAIRGSIADAEQGLRTLGAGLGEADGAALRLAQETGPQLVEALVRVRETANQAASHAREAIVAAIPDAVAALSDASREAVEQAVTEPVQDQLAEIAGASQRALMVARQASERLTRQLLTMSETAQAIEDRISEDQARREEKDADALSRRVALLIEALNSTAIDVSKLLSNDVADSAWAAYLKGDRGVFTRRAVRLLESGEAREILRHYEAEPDFREQVNRYLHDFETMLRRVLADREGGTLAVTLLSSDMGKLYVALAQATERLRR